MLAELLTSLLILIGAGFALVGSIGLARLPDFFTRLHGPTKATTLGVGSVVVASLVHSSAVSGTLSLRELAISLFLFITAPISAHLLAKTALKIIGPGDCPLVKAPMHDDPDIVSSS
jgi:multicomponent K+:H+ antiporter subunit G